MEKTSKKTKDDHIKNKVAKKANSKQKVKKENFFVAVKKEMRLVKWPTWKEVIKNTIATLVLCLLICGFFMLLNLGLSAIKGWFVK